MNYCTKSLATKLPHTEKYAHVLKKVRGFCGKIMWSTCLHLYQLLCVKETCTLFSQICQGRLPSGEMKTLRYESYRDNLSCRHGLTMLVKAAWNNEHFIPIVFYDVKVLRSSYYTPIWRRFSMLRPRNLLILTAVVILAGFITGLLTSCTPNGLQSSTSLAHDTIAYGVYQAEVDSTILDYGITKQCTYIYTLTLDSLESARMIQSVVIDKDTIKKLHVLFSWRIIDSTHMEHYNSMVSPYDQGSALWLPYDFDSRFDGISYIDTITPSSFREVHSLYGSILWVLK